MQTCQIVINTFIPCLPLCLLVNAIKRTVFKMLLLKVQKLQMRLKYCEDEVKNEKCVTDAKDAEMESVR